MVRVIKEHEDFYVAYKPAGVDFHDSEEGVGFFNQCKEFFSDSALYPVHRLDKQTSGLLIIARNRNAESQLSALFKKRQIEKYYIALASKKPKKKQGTIKGDMVRSRRKSWKLLKSCDNPAITQFFSYGLCAGIRFFYIRLLTGKTHQIRVALKSVGSPILGDDIYAGTKSDRLYLHAYRLRFSYMDEMLDVAVYPQSGLVWKKCEEYCWEILENVDVLLWPRVKQ